MYEEVAGAAECDDDYGCDSMIINASKWGFCCESDVTEHQSGASVKAVLLSWCTL